MKTKIFFIALLFGSKLVFAQSYFIPRYKNSNFKVEETTNDVRGNKPQLAIDNDAAALRILSKVEPLIDSINNEIKKAADPNAKTEEVKDISTLEKVKDLVKNLQTLKYKHSEKKESEEKLDSLKVLLTEDNFKILDDYVKSLKSQYTLNRFLTRFKTPKTFCILESNLYDVDQINTYFTDNAGLGTLSNFSLQTYSNATYINAELISFHFNYVRLGVAASLKAMNNSKTDAEAVKQELTKVFQNSGSLNLNFSVPILFHRNKNDQVHYGVFAETNVGLTPNLSDADSAYFSSDLLVNSQAGVNIKFDISSNEEQEAKKARFYFEFPVKYIFGNKRSYQLLDVNDNTTFKLNIGAVLGDKISLQISGPLFSTSDSIMKVPFLFSINFSASDATKSKP